MVALRTPTVALVGNPNTGKTTLFNALAGMNQRVGNYAGVTVETKKGKLRVGELLLDVIDLPGTYSLAPRSPDEMLAVDVILGNSPSEPRPDVVVTIVDASNLERNLYLMTQVLELGVPVIVALNMIDVAEGQGLKIDVDKLSQQLGVPVVPIQANKGKGLDRLKAMIAKVLEQPTCVNGPVFPDAFETEINRLKTTMSMPPPIYLIRRLLLDAGGHAEKQLTDQHGAGLAADVKAARARLVQAGFTLAGIEATLRYRWIRERTAGCIARPEHRPVAWTDRIDKVLTHRIWGTLIFLLVMFLVFETIFVAATPFMDWIKEGVAWLGGAVGDWLTPGPFRSLVVTGIIGGVGAVVVFIPQIVFLFAILALLEDCGYMARAAFLMDRLMSRAGLNGKSFIPLLSSFACAVPGIMAARVIENRRDRLATILVAPLMSCSARLPVYSLLIGAFLPTEEFGLFTPGLVFFGLYMIGIIVAPLMAFCLKSTLLRGETPVFVMEMPLYKMPSFLAVLRRSIEAGWMFLKRAGTFILASMIIVWALLYFPRGDFTDQIEKLDAELKVQRNQLSALEKATDQADAAESLKSKIEATEAELAELRADGDYETRVERFSELLKEPREKLEALEKELKVLEKNNADGAVIAGKKKEIETLEEEIKPTEEKLNEASSQWKAQSYLGRVGHWIEPAVKPLGWDWRIGMAALASFPAREVMVGTLGIIFAEGEGDAGDAKFQRTVGNTLRKDAAFSIPVAMSVLVFFALCSQCVSTLVVIKRESGSWFWPIFTFVYMTALAYAGAFLTFQIGSLF